jgi:rRNA maturation protein Nop10
MEGICSFCGNKIEILDKVNRRDTCPACGRDLHCCWQCRFYDESSYNACREPQAERVLDKEKANFCDYFEYAGKVPLTGKKQEHISKLEGLFKKK